MKRFARITLGAFVVLAVAVPGLAAHTNPCPTDAYLALGAKVPPGNDDGCTNPNNPQQHCDLWIQSGAFNPAGTCISL